MLDLQQFFIREHAGLLKLTDTYDILNPETQEKIGIAKEEVSGLVTALRLLINKRLLPTKVVVRGEDGEVVFVIRRPVAIFRAQVDVVDGDGKRVGYFVSKLFSLGGGFWVYDDGGKQFAEVKGDWKGWNFRFLTPDGQELGVVTKKWAGLAKEMFTSADNYVVSISDDLADQPTAKMLLLAAALAEDVVFKEGKG